MGVGGRSRMVFEEGMAGSDIIALPSLISFVFVDKHTSWMACGWGENNKTNKLDSLVDCYSEGLV